MNTKINKFFIYLFLSVPLFLITGPAIPDIIITFTSIYFLVYLIFFERNIYFLNNLFFKITIFFLGNTNIYKFFCD